MFTSIEYIVYIYFGQIRSWESIAITLAITHLRSVSLNVANRGQYKFSYLPLKDQSKMSVKLVLALCAFFGGIFALPVNLKGIQIKNNRTEKLWIVMTGEESFVLPAGQIASVLLEQNWAGKIYGQSVECQFEKCNTPYTVAELKFGLQNGEDKYKVSLMNGFNKPLMIRPTNPYEYCKPASCNVNILNHCPKVHQVFSNKGVLVACKANHEVFHDLCPEAVTSDAEENSNTFICTKSNTYEVAFV